MEEKHVFCSFYVKSHVISSSKMAAADRKRFFIPQDHNTTPLRGDFARHFSHDEWLISLESLKILLLSLLKPF